MNVDRQLEGDLVPCDRCGELFERDDLIPGEDGGVYCEACFEGAEKDVISLRGLRWTEDREPLLALDASFTTDRVYRVVATGTSFVLEDVAIAPPLHKVYYIADDVDSLPQFDHVVVAEVDARIGGMAALKFDSWNRRAVLWHLYVTPAYRGRGIGRALMNDVVQTAQHWQARCVWLETQNVNYPAIQFYRQLGFQWCGLDMTLYDSQGPAASETALFFARTLP